MDTTHIEKQERGSCCKMTLVQIIHTGEGGREGGRVEADAGEGARHSVTGEGIVG